MRYIAPRILSFFIKNAQKNMMNDMGVNDQVKRKKEGEVNIDYIPKKKKEDGKEELGDYTDFEEINE